MILPDGWICTRVKSRCSPEYQLDGRWRSISWQKGSRATCPTVRSRFPSLWSAVQKNTIPHGHPRILELWSRSTRSRPEHENNEPALGVAELVDRRGWKGTNEGEGTVGALYASQVARSRKRNRHRLFRNERLGGLSESILAHSMSPE